MVLTTGAWDRAELATAVGSLLGETADYVFVFRDGEIKPSLCFGRISGKLILPDAVRNVEAAITYIKAIGGSDASRIEPYDLYLYSTATMNVSANDAVTLTLMLNNYLFNNISFFNHVEDLVYAKLAEAGLAGLTDVVPDFDTFATLIRGHFDVLVNIAHLTDGHQDVVSLCRYSPLPLDGSPFFRYRAMHSVQKEQVIEFIGPLPPSLRTELELIEGSGDYHTYQYIFPLRCKSRAHIRTNEFMVVVPAERPRLSLLEIFSINQAVEEYAYARTRRGQQKCLYWQTDELAKLIESVDDSWSELSNMFATYMTELADLVIASTQGHSFAYLSYDASEDALTRIFSTFEAGEGVVGDEIPATVPLSAHRRYVSAFLFCLQAEDPIREIYIPAIRKREEYAHLGLQTVTCRRNQLIEKGLASGEKTRSEAAFVVHDQGVPVGVICIECPYKGGLKNDMDFLRQVANNASIYRSFLFRIGDQRWLRRNLKLQDVSHELEKLQLVISDPAARERLEQITRELELDITTSESDACTFEERRDRLVLEEAGGSGALATELADLVRIFNPPEHRVPPVIQMAAIHIVRILLRNRVHASTPQPVTVVTRDAHAGVKNALLIKTELELNRPQVEIDQAFRQPIRRSDREHVGLYMIGVVVRAWGGRLDFDRRVGVRKRKLEICIPFERNYWRGEGDVGAAHPGTSLRA